MLSDNLQITTKCSTSAYEDRMSISRESIQERCITLIAQAKQLPPASIHPGSTFEELALDSLDKVTLAYDVEEAYNIRIPESSLANITTVQEMVSGIQHALSVPPTIPSPPASDHV